LNKSSLCLWVGDFEAERQSDGTAAIEPVSTQDQSRRLPCTPCSLLAAYEKLAVFEASCLLVTLQCGISPMHKSLHRHVAALSELLHLAGKIPQSESPGHTSVVTPEIEEDLRAIQETVHRQMVRCQSAHKNLGDDGYMQNTGHERHAHESYP
jgi:hypothetical protein